MLRKIIARATHPALTHQDQRRTRLLAGTKFSSRPRGDLFGFPDWRERWPFVPRQNFHSNACLFSAGPRVYLDEKIRTEILENRKCYELKPVEPPGFEKLYPLSAQKLIEHIRDHVCQSAPFPGQHNESLQKTAKKTLEKNFFAAVHTIASARKVMIFCGRNSEEGKLSHEGPVSAAIAAYALYKCYKVAIIVSDEPNKRLIQALLSELDTKCARFITYLPINQVNGTLLSTLSKHIATRKPDVTLYIDVPGRNRDGDYLDAKGKSIALSNVAFDQALNIQNALEMETIAICSSINTAGFPKPEEEERRKADIGGNDAALRAVLPAKHSLVVSNVITATLSLMELVSNAWTDLKVCETSKLKTLMDTAARMVENNTFQAPILRKLGKARPPWREAAPVQITEDHPAIKALEAIHQTIDASHVMWPASFEKIKLDGPETRHIVMFDSSDGVLIATEDFLDYVRARSHFHIKVHAVTDHEKRPYGKFLPDQLFHIVVNGVAFCAMLKGDVIVMLCNTACTTGLEKIRHLVEKWLITIGLHYKVDVIDLVETVAAAVVSEGGPEPVLLSTQATKESNAYPRAIEAAAKKDGREAPLVTVIGCGDRSKRPQDDWATFVNDGAYLASHPEHKVFLFSVESYVNQIPLSASSIWLCCTHFPILHDFIRRFLNERLAAHGMPKESIHIIDPLPYQAEATIAYLERTKPVKGKEYGALRDLSVSTTGNHEIVGKSVSAHIKREKPPIFEVAFPHVPMNQETVPHPSLKN